MIFAQKERNSRESEASNATHYKCDADANPQNDTDITIHDVIKVVVTHPSGPIEKREKEERERPDSHAEFVHLRAAEDSQEGWHKDNLKSSR